MFKKAFLVIVFSMLLVSCFCKKNPFTENEKTWIKVYQNNKKVVFKSNRGKLDTFNIIKEDTFSNMECNMMAFGRYQNQWFHISLKRTMKSDDFFSMSFEKKRKGPSRLNFDFLGASYSEKLNKKKIYIRKYDSNSYKTNSDSTFYFRTGFNLEVYDKTKIKSFCWNKKDGLLMYEKFNGEVFELYSKE